jgi:hypothetical protein
MSETPILSYVIPDSLFKQLTLVDVVSRKKTWGSAYLKVLLRENKTPVGYVVIQPNESTAEFIHTYVEDYEAAHTLFSED